MFRVDQAPHSEKLDVHLKDIVRRSMGRLGAGTPEGYKAEDKGDS